MIISYKKCYSGIVGLILIPLILNYFTNTVTWNDFWNNGWMILFLLSILICLPFIIHTIQINTKPNSTDIKVVSKLFKILIKSDIEYILRDMHNNLPIGIENMSPIWNFLNESNKTENSIYNKKLKYYFGNFQNALQNYSSVRANYTFPIGTGNEMAFGFDSELKSRNDTMYRERVKELDDLASTAYDEYKELIVYSKSKDLDLFNEN